jgi:hypothetical protein
MLLVIKVGKSEQQNNNKMFTGREGEKLKIRCKGAPVSFARIKKK